MKPLWLLDTYLLERSTPEDGTTFAAALIKAGCEVSEHSFDPRGRILTGDLPSVSDRPVMTYGSYAFVRHVLSAVAPTVPRPGSYMRIENLSFHRFAAHLGDLLLNDDFHILPFGELRRRPAPSASVFVRPDRVTKSFTGFEVRPDRFEYEMSCLDLLSGVGPEELVVVASAKPIELECRYVIADGKVVAKSTYGWAGGFKPSTATDRRCDDVAREVAMRDWQPDTVYTCDVALSGDRGRVVELNSFSCSGLYACDTVAVADAVSACLLDEFGMLAD
ncbi:ATP-grasp domain-containing protein [Rhizobium laguerreae]|nr:ATP-grasp domain-containing protein [Rhizobium laguerreae]